VRPEGYIKEKFCNIPAFSPVPQSTAPPRDPPLAIKTTLFLINCHTFQPFFFIYSRLTVTLKCRNMVQFIKENISFL
jgi:hypothetical protein